MPRYLPIATPPLALLAALGVRQVAARRPGRSGDFQMVRVWRMESSTLVLYRRIGPAS